MDISKFDVVKNAEKGFKLYFKNPYDLTKELPIFMVVMGADSKAYKNALRAKKIEIINASSVSKEKKTIDDLEQIDEDNIALLTKLVIGVGETEDKKDIDFILDGKRECKATKKDITHLLTKFPWMTEQVTGAIATRSNFLE